MALTPKSLEIIFLNYNGSATLAETLQSIGRQTFWNSQVKQQLSKVSLLFSDNGSTDSSISLAETQKPYLSEMRIQKRTPGTGGVFSHYNLCLRETTADLLLFCHTDDIYLENFLEKTTTFLIDNPNVAAVLTGGSYIDNQGRPLWEAPPPENCKTGVLERRAVLLDLMTHGNRFLLAPSAMFRVSALQELGHFDETKSISGDVEMWLRILYSTHWQLGYIAESLYLHRLSTTQLSATETKTVPKFSDFFDTLLPFQKIEGLKSPIPAVILESFEAQRTAEELSFSLQNRNTEGLIQIHSKIKTAGWATATRGLGRINKTRFFLTWIFLPVWKLSDRFLFFKKAAAAWILKTTDLRQSAILKPLLRLKRRLR